MLNTPFSPWPSFTAEEGDAIRNVLLSNKVNYWTGTECRSFENEFARWVGTTHAIALTNGTVALDLALHGLGIGAVNGGLRDDEVVVTPRTFIASVSSVVNAGAKPVFADVDFDSGNITADTIAAALSPATKAVIIVHLAGWPCDMDPIMALAAQRGIKVIEDCAQAHGAMYRGRSVGSIGHVGAWSFCQDKIMTTAGEGGMITCNDDALWKRMWAFKDHGKSWDAVYEREHPPGFRWLHESIGTNWRMTEVQGAVGRIQLRHMQEWSRKRRENAARLVTALQPFSQVGGAVRVPLIVSSVEETCHANYKFYFYIRPEGLRDGWTRDRIVQAINDRGVPAYQGTCSEVYLEKAITDLDLLPREPLSNARRLGATSIMLLVHPTLTHEETDLSCRVLQDVLSEAQL